MYWLITVADKEVHKYPHRQPEMILIKLQLNYISLPNKFSLLSSLLEREILINQIAVSKEEYETNHLELEQRVITAN